MGPLGPPWAPWSPRVPQGGPHGPHGAPMAHTGPVACVSHGARDSPGLFHRKMLLRRKQNEILALDLAKGGAETTRDPINPLPRTWVYSIFRRRAGHLPPDPNILHNFTNPTLENFAILQILKILVRGNRLSRDP